MVKNTDSMNADMFTCTDEAVQLISSGKRNVSNHTWSIHIIYMYI